jgi:small redox-active disulfide protein 2
MRKLQILRTGCPKCKKLEENAEAAAKALGIEYTMEKVTDINKIMKMGVMMTPAVAEEYRCGGESPLEAVHRAAPIRVRPILMTQLTTVLGALPLALNRGEGGDMLNPMAIAVIGGLLYSLLLTLLFLPAAYGLIRCKDQAPVATALAGEGASMEPDPHVQENRT